MPFTPEDQAREQIARALQAAGWIVQHANALNIGAGQYFTPRALIQAMVDVMRPEPDTRICDPACGTGGFLLAAHDFISHHYALDRDQKKHLRFDALHG